MSEIKSTLDIIMERTKGLTLSDEERQAFHEKEMDGKIQGLLQKFLDGLMDMEKLRLEFEGFGSEDREKARDILSTRCFEKLHPARENQAVLEVLEEVVNARMIPIRTALDAAIAELETVRPRLLEKVRKDLSLKGISGSAVVPNLDADLEWGKAVSRMKDRLHERLLSSKAPVNGRK